MYHMVHHCVQPVVPNLLYHNSSYCFLLNIFGPIRQVITRQFDEIQDKPIFSGPALTILKSCYLDASQWLVTTGIDCWTLKKITI